MHRSLFVLLWLPLAACSALPSAQAADAPHAERVAAAQATYEAVHQAHGMGAARLEEVCAWSIRWHQAQTDAGDAGASKAHLARMEALAAKVAKDVETGVAAPRDAQAMRYFVAEAKVWAQP